MSQRAFSIQLSTMASNVQPSATLAAAAKAREMKANGIEVFDFSTGEPDFNTPEHICKAAWEAMQSGHTHYTPAPGIREIREAICKRYQSQYGIEYGIDQVIVSNGAKHSIHNVLAALCDPGDEVLIPTPYWVSYSDLVQMTGAKYILLPTTMSNGFKLTPQQLRDAITPKSKLLMLNSPSNPTGAVYTRAELEAIADVALDSGVMVMSDEIYEQLIYDGEPTCFATLRPGLQEQVITISGVSKSYAMTGWRIGWALGPAPLIKAMSSIQSQETGNPCSVSQYAAIAALEGDQSCVAEMKKEFQERRSLVCDKLSSMPGVKCREPEGAFYAFFDISDYFGKAVAGKVIESSTDFAIAALESIQVNLVTGQAFGANGFVRMSYAASKDQLNKGLDRLEQWLQNA